MQKSQYEVSGVGWVKMVVEESKDDYEVEGRSVARQAKRRALSRIVSLPLTTTSSCVKC